jgi:hypothetical protein
LENPFAEALADLNMPNYKKMTFDEQCGYYAAIRSDVPLQIVAKVGGFSPSVATYLNAAGERRGGQVRYPKVARMYAALGHEAFVHTYLTARLRQECLEAIADLKRERREKARKRAGIPANVMRYCRIYRWPKTELGQPVAFRIEPAPDGYRWRNLKPFYDQPEWPPEKWPLLKADGDENGESFATPLDCFKYVKALYKPLG